MLAAECVFGRVTVRRTVTTKGGPAGLTSAQVNPGRANLDALFALSADRGFNLRNRFYV
jgi:hypothetical protein